MNYKYIIYILALLIILSILGYYYKAKDEFDFVENFDNFSNYVLQTFFERSREWLVFLEYKEGQRRLSAKEMKARYILFHNISNSNPI